jgi:hypothetical protein
MIPTPEIRPLRARLVCPRAALAGLPPRRRCYRPLVVGVAVLRQQCVGGRWVVSVSDDGRLLPVMPPGFIRLRQEVMTLRPAGGAWRLAAALVAPEDLAGPPPRLVRQAESPRLEFYGWSLLVQRPGMRGLAVVDRHEQFADLPACYESPLELIDRSEFLAARGIRSRPLALVTQPADFTASADGRLCNRFFPAERFRPPKPLDWLA